mgnify:CR=1 FL=1
MEIDMMKEPDVMVYLMTGFLDSGKTQFLNFTLSQDYFQIDGKTLLILCEEGEEEYDPRELLKYGVVIETVEDKEDLTEEWLEEMNKMINMVIVILTGIASISLLVGGIGIMNIMLVSVTERTREIGIRKALGAQESTILTQFVVEAGVTSALGGCLGIVLGYVVSAIINQILPYILTDITLNVTPSADAAAIAVGISCGIGVLFGFLPARRAASLNPIEALRYD